MAMVCPYIHESGQTWAFTCIIDWFHWVRRLLGFAQTNLHLIDCHCPFHGASGCDRPRIPKALTNEGYGNGERQLRVLGKHLHLPTEHTSSERYDRESPTDLSLEKCSPAGWRNKTKPEISLKTIESRQQVSISISMGSLKICDLYI